MSSKLIVKRLRLISGLSLRKFAELFGVSHTTVANWEKDIRYPTRKHAKQLIQFAEQNNIQLKMGDLYE